MSSCNCGCTDNITSLEGPQGSDGTSTEVVSTPISTVAAYHGLTTVRRLDTATDDIYNGGNGYAATLITIPTVAAANLMIVDFNAQINATDIHDVTVTILAGGVPVANLGRIQNCGTRESLSGRFEVGNVTAGTVYTLKFLSSSAVVTAVIRGGHFRTDIYA